MCIRRIRLLQNIENVTARDIVIFLKRAVRIYIIFSILAIYNAVIAGSNSSKLLFLIKILDAIFYCFNTGSIMYFTTTPTLCNLYFPLASATLLWFFYIASIVLQAIGSRHNGPSADANIGVAVFTGLISLVLLGSTIFILLKLRTKMIVEGTEGGINMAEAQVVTTPMAANAYYSGQVATATPVASAPVMGGNDFGTKKYSNNV